MAGSIDRLTASGFRGMAEIEDLLEWKADVLFGETADSNIRLTPVLAQLVKFDLDISRISNRLLVMGRCWSRRTDKAAHRNNIDDLSTLLNTKYKRQH